MKNRITRITAALAAAALLAGCGSISSKDGGYYTTEAAAQESYNYDSAAGRDGQQPDARQRRRGCH